MPPAPCASCRPRYCRDQPVLESRAWVRGRIGVDEVGVIVGKVSQRAVLDRCRTRWPRHNGCPTAPSAPPPRPVASPPNGSLCRTNAMPSAPPILVAQIDIEAEVEVGAPGRCARWTLTRPSEPAHPGSSMKLLSGGVVGGVAIERHPATHLLGQQLAADVDLRPSRQRRVFRSCRWRTASSCLE